METTANFRAGLQTAYDELSREGKLSATDHEIAGKVLSEPYRRKERRIALLRAHIRVRRLYARKTGAILPRTLDWTKLVEWLKANWFEVVKILASILIFLV